MSNHRKQFSFFENNEVIFSCSSTLFTNLALNGKDYAWLIDTGASLSAIKCKHLLEHNIEFIKERSCINGIGGTIQAIGYVFIQLEINGHCFQHKFFVFDTIPCVTAGILGSDFLEKYRSILDYNTNTLTLIGTDNINITMPVLRVSHDFHDYNYLIPARSESVYFIKTSMSEDCMVCTQQICDGIYIAGSIVRPTNGKIPIQVLNTTETELSLHSLEPEIHKLSDYYIFQFGSSGNNADRVKKLLPQIKLGHLNQEEQRAIENICAKFADIFHLSGDKLTATDICQQSIQLKPNVEPAFSKPYRLPQAHKAEINRQITEMLKDGIIEPSQSEWSSPILLVPKKNVSDCKIKWRLVIDYRKVNERIKDDKFPLPNISEIFDSLSGAIYYSHLDLFSGYYQMELSEESRKYTAFCTPQCQVTKPNVNSINEENNANTCSGQYQMKRMPMGLKTSPNAFSRMINIAMSGLAFDKCFVYLDDLIVFGRSLDDHNKNLFDVFSRLRKVNLKLNPQKCDFLKREILYLGHVITADGILPDPSKIKVMAEYPIPKNLDEVKRFVAFSNYYRKFISNFAEIAYPLNKLCRKDQPFIWDTQCQNSFEKLRNALLSPPVLQYPDFSDANEFQLQTDASGYAIAGVLSNKNGRPVAYTSRGLNKAETNYPTIEKELLAIVWSIKYFRPYLLGKHFKVITDHKPLVYLFSMKDPSSRLTKFRLQLEEYNFTVEYVKGKDNAPADALSRIRLTSNELKEMNESVMNVMTRAQARKLTINNDENTTHYVPSDYTVSTDQPRVIGINNKPKESVELSFINEEKLNKLIKDNLITERSYQNILMYVPSKKVIYINPCSHSQFTRAVFVKELEEFCKKCSVQAIYCIKNKESSIFIETLAKEIKKTSEWNGPRLFVLQGIQRIDDKDDQRVILNDFHLLPTSGHAGIRRMFNKIRKYYYWPGLERDINNFVSRCDKCQRQKHSTYVKEPMTITTTAHTAMEKIFLDVVGPLDQDHKGYRYILTMQCELSKFVQAVPLLTKSTSEVAQAFVNSFILSYGIPTEIATDRGTEFLSSTMAEVCTLLNITKLQSTAYHHQSIGALENSHKNLGAYLRIQTDNHPESWSNWLPFWCFSYNTSVHTETKFTPFELVYGKKCILPSNLSNGTIDPLYTCDDYPKELKYRLQVSQKEARDNLIFSKTVRKNVYDKNSKSVVYKPNDLVVIKKENCSKFDSPWTEPYTVIRDLSPNVELIKDGKISIVHKNRTKLYKS